MCTIATTFYSNYCGYSLASKVLQLRDLCISHQKRKFLTSGTSIYFAHPEATVCTWVLHLLLHKKRIHRTQVIFHYSTYIPIKICPCNSLVKPLENESCLALIQTKHYHQEWCKQQLITAMHFLIKITVTAIF